jgi:hypothetical protein
MVHSLLTMPEPLDSIFTTMGVFTIGLALSFTIVALCIHKHEEEKPIPYEQKYYDEFEELSDVEMTDDDKKALLDKFLEEETESNGKVIMSYNHDKEHFQYWCNDKSIKYMTLEAVAHKYTINNKCKSICIDYKYEYEQAVEKLRKHKMKLEEQIHVEDDKKKEEEQKKDVFAKFKSYNSVNKETSVSDEKPTLVTEKANRYKYCGTIEEWEKEQAEKENKAVSSSHQGKMSVADFLRQRKTEETN